MTTDYPNDATPDRKTAKPAVADAQTQRALARVRTALERRNGAEAIRFFKDAVAHGLIREDEALLVWLRQAMGDDAAEKLLAAYARLPCFYCHSGVIPCEECNGRGHDADNRPCAECLALGVDRCGFCGGSGWFTINHVPGAFRLRVMARRVAAAAKEAETLLAAAKVAVSPANLREARKAAAKTLLQGNRLLCVLENMRLAATQAELYQPDSGEIVAKIVAACAKLSPPLSARVHELLTMLAEVAALEAAAAKRSSSRRMAEARCEFYRHVVSSRNSATTLLAHPFLYREDSGTAPPAKPADTASESDTVSEAGDR
ncbi:MAG TPA: hypothetical protein PKK06_13635 [Phycisphaerae bacterium]|nr:hypothetical protein [Phycisphaerae bacterium]HNU46127.1 hypothetical protein [Phycisphaerae bacterium]